MSVDPRAASIDLIEVIEDWVDASGGGRLDPTDRADRARAVPEGSESAEGGWGRARVAQSAPAGRVVLAVGVPLADDAAAETLVTRLCRELSGGGPATRLLEEHAAPDDLAHWARVDAVRAVLVADLDVVICAHDLQRPRGHQLITLEVPERHVEAVVPAVVRVAGQTTATAGPAVAAHARRDSGRAMVFPGQPSLAGDLAVQQVLGRTAIDEVHSVHGRYHPDAMLSCHGYARPRYRAGRLVLSVGHDRPDRLVAVEVRYSRPCCGEHAPR